MTERGMRIGSIVLAGLANLSAYGIFQVRQDIVHRENKNLEVGRSADELLLAASFLALRFEPDENGLPVKVIDPQPTRAIEHLDEAETRMRAVGLHTQTVNNLIIKIAEGKETTVEQFADERATITAIARPIEESYHNNNSIGLRHSFLLSGGLILSIGSIFGSFGLYLESRVIRKHKKTTPVTPQPEGI